MKKILLITSLVLFGLSACFEEPENKNDSEYDEVDSVSEMVSAENGGTVTTEDNEAAVSVTAGALTEDTRISIVWDDPTDYPESDKLGTVIY